MADPQTSADAEAPCAENRLEVVPRFVRKGRGATPWLEQFREPFGQASRACADRTRELKGQERVLAINACISGIIRGEDDSEVEVLPIDSSE